MFLFRHKRSTRDRESGLVFQWRLPLGSHFSFFMAIGLVALISVGLAAAVRIRVGGPPRQPERRGSLILVPQGGEWQALELLALEAGPMPRREDPAHDPAVRALIEEGMVAASPPGYSYQPRLRPVSVPLPAVGPPDSSRLAAGILPPLPAPREPSQNPPAPDPSRPLLLSHSGLRALPPATPPPAALARGNRYLLGYDAAGRVTRVTPLFTAGPAADPQGETWLRQLVIEGGSKDGGWTAVEISSGP